MPSRALDVLILAAVIGLAIALSIRAQAGEFYQWTTPDGTVEFTDDPKQVPESFQDQAVKRTTEALSQSRRVLLTPHSTSTHATDLELRLQELRDRRSRLGANPNHLVRCDGPVTVTSERRQTGSSNRRLFIITDECGRTVSVTPHYPDIQVNR